MLLNQKDLSHSITQSKQALTQGLSHRDAQQPMKIDSKKYLDVPDLGEDKQVFIFTPQVPATKVAVPTPPPNGEVPDSSSRQIPIIKVMPQLPMNAPPLLPRTEEEHHLILREKYPLIKSPGFNAAVALFLLGATALFASGFMNGFPALNHPSTYIASVGAALPVPPIRQTPLTYDSSEQPLLPFSDEVTITKNSHHQSTLVQPVFRDEFVGDTYEYTIVSRKIPTLTTEGE
jgi:hypothetical protein